MIALVRHPGAASAVTAVRAQARRVGARGLALRFEVDDPAGGLVLPPVAGAAPARTDGLWRRTCFEAFLRAPGAAGYLELNVAPAGDWAAYRFDGYRAGMAEAAVAAQAVSAAQVLGRFELAAAVELPEAPDGPWDVALTAVIEDAAGVSYWALAHPPGDADFHAAAGFVLSLPC